MEEPLSDARKLSARRFAEVVRRGPRMYATSPPRGKRICSWCLNAPDLTLIGMHREKGSTYELPPQLGQIGALALEGHPCHPETRRFPRRPLKRRLLDRAHEDRLRPRGGWRPKTL